MLAEFLPNNGTLPKLKPDGFERELTTQRAGLLTLLYEFRQRPGSHRSQN